MIAHPTAATLTAKYGNTAAGRRKARAELVETMVAAARREAATAARSISCETRSAFYGPGHEPCGNDGTGCLCECHDQPEDLPPAVAS